jgi:hypothetical protein
MTELFANSAATTLSAAITTTAATSVSVASALGFPVSGNFRIKIDSEILIVTGVAGTTFTVVRGAEGTVAATHASGAAVVHLLTKGGLEARVANRFISDAYATKPAAGVAGRLFLPTDGMFLEYDDGANWHKYGPYRRLKAPPTTGWTWVNQGNATATFNGSTLVLEDPDLDATNPQLRILVRNVATPIKVTMGFLWNGIITNGNPFMGFCIRQSGGTNDGKMQCIGIMASSSSWQIRNQRYTSATATRTGAAFSSGVCFPQRVVWFRCEQVDGNIRISHSSDGVNFLLLETTNDSSNWPNQFGIFIDPVNNNQKCSLSLVSWEEG